MKYNTVCFPYFRYTRAVLKKLRMTSKMNRMNRTVSLFWLVKCSIAKISNEQIMLATYEENRCLVSCFLPFRCLSAS